MMRMIIAAALTLATAPLLAQTPGQPGKPDKAMVTAGTYKVDVNHTQVTWQVNHMNFTMLQGQFPASGGTLMIDPANPSAAKVDVTFATDKPSTTSEHFTTHLMTKEIFDAATYPTAHFVSTRVTVNGDKATIVGNLTLMNMTKPVTLDATFIGTGKNPNSGKATVGFRATASIKRTDFGMKYAVPVVSDNVDLVINAAFEL